MYEVSGFPFLKMAIETDNLAANGNILGNNGLVSIIFRLQPDMVIFLVEALNRSVIIAYQGYNDITVLGMVLFRYDEVIAFLNACLDHAVPADHQDEAVVVAAHHFSRQREDRFQMLIGHQRFAGADSTYQRHGNHFLVAPGHISYHFDGSGAGRISLDNSQFLQPGQVSVNRRSGTKIDCRADFTDSRGNPSS